MRFERDVVSDDVTGALDARVIAALAKAPRVEIPVGFAARVAARSRPKFSVAEREPRYGRLALYGGLIVLVAAMLVAARFVAPGATLLVECVLVAELVGLSVYMGLVPGMLRG